MHFFVNLFVFYMFKIESKNCFLLSSDFLIFAFYGEIWIKSGQSVWVCCYVILNKFCKKTQNLSKILISTNKLLLEKGDGQNPPQLFLKIPKGLKYITAFNKSFPIHLKRSHVVWNFFFLKWVKYLLLLPTKRFNLLLRHSIQKAFSTIKAFLWRKFSLISPFVNWISHHTLFNA